MNKNINIESSYKIMLFALIYGISFYYLKTFSKQNSWLIIIVSNFLGFLFIKMFLKIKNFYKNKSIYEINKIALGKIPGAIINIIFVLTFAMLSSITLWYLYIFLKSNFLEKTPVIIIGIMTILPLFYSANKNNSILIKSNVIFFAIILFLLVLAIIFLLPQVELNELKPFEEINFNQMINSIFTFTSVSYLPTYSLLSITNLNIKSLLKVSFKTLFLNLSIVLSTYLVLGNSIVQIVDFPQFFVLRKIGVFANGTRIDSLIIIGWFLSIYATNCTFIFYIRNYLKSEIKKYNNYYTYLLILAIFIISLFIFKNVTIGKIFILKILPYILFFTLFLINFFIYLALKISHKN